MMRALFIVGGAVGLCGAVVLVLYAADRYGLAAVLGPILLAACLVYGGKIGGMFYREWRERR